MRALQPSTKLAKSSIFVRRFENRGLQSCLQALLQKPQSCLQAQYFQTQKPPFRDENRGLQSCLQALPKKPQSCLQAQYFQTQKPFFRDENRGLQSCLQALLQKPQSCLQGGLRRVVHSGFGHFERCSPLERWLLGYATATLFAKCVIPVDRELLNRKPRAQQ